MDILICSPSHHSTTTRQPFFSLLLLRLSDSVATFKIGKFLVSRFYTSRRTVTNWLSALADANSFPYDLSSRTLPSISPSSIRYFSLLSYLFLMFSPKLSLPIRYLARISPPSGENRRPSTPNREIPAIDPRRF